MLLAGSTFDYTLWDLNWLEAGLVIAGAIFLGVTLAGLFLLWVAAPRRRDQ